METTLQELETVVLEATAETMEMVGELLADQLLIIGFNVEPDTSREAPVGAPRNGGQIVKVKGMKIPGRIVWEVADMHEDAAVSHPLVDGWEFKDGLPKIAAYQRRVAAVLNEWAGEEVAQCADKLMPKPQAKSFAKTKEQKVVTPSERKVARKEQQRRVDDFVPTAQNNAALKALIRKINAQLAEQPSAEGLVSQVMFDLDGEPVIIEQRVKAQRVTA